MKEFKKPFLYRWTRIIKSPPRFLIKSQVMNNQNWEDK